MIRQCCVNSFLIVPTKKSAVAGFQTVLKKGFSFYTVHHIQHFNCMTIVSFQIQSTGVQNQMNLCTLHFPSSFILPSGSCDDVLFPKCISAISCLTLIHIIQLNWNYFNSSKSEREREVISTHCWHNGADDVLSFKHMKCVHTCDLFRFFSKVRKCSKLFGEIWRIVWSYLRKWMWAVTLFPKVFVVDIHHRLQTDFYFNIRLFVY